MVTINGITAASGSPIQVTFPSSSSFVLFASLMSNWRNCNSWKSHLCIREVRLWFGFVQHVHQLFGNRLERNKQYSCWGWQDIHGCLLCCRTSTRFVVPCDKQKNNPDGVHCCSDDCGQYPANGQITFTDINIELDNKPVTPSWKGYQCMHYIKERFAPPNWYTVNDACNANPTVISPSSVQFTWDTSAKIVHKAAILH